MNGGGHPVASLRPVFLWLALLGLGHALGEGNGALAGWARWGLTAALLFSFVAFLGPWGPSHVPFFPTVHRAAALLGLTGVFAFNLAHLPGVYVQATLADWRTFQAVMGLAYVASLVWVLHPGKWDVPLGGMILSAFLLSGLWVIAHSPSPHIDVFYFQQEAVNALLAGQNPYAIRFRDIYSPADSARFYGEGLSVDGVLQFGFPYPPASLLLALPGKVFANDVRYGQWVALALAAVLLFRCRPASLWARAAAVFCLFSPRGLFVLEQSWTEPFLLYALSHTVYLAQKRSRWTWVPLGLLLGLKQYMVLFVPLLWLLGPAFLPRQQLFRALSLAAASLMPFFLWGPRDFLHSVVMLHLQQPYRAESLGYLSWLSALGLGGLQAWTGFLLAIAVMSIALFRRARGPETFALSLAVASMVFFAFNKQAFANYYSFVLGALCVALSTGNDATEGGMSTCQGRGS